MRQVGLIEVKVRLGDLQNNARLFRQSKKLFKFFYFVLFWYLIDSCLKNIGGKK